MTNTRIPAPKQPQKLEEMLTKIPSFWITGVHITMQFGEVRRLWIPISFAAIATIRFLGQFTISGLNVAADSATTIDPQH
jgi:hypothetical protein